MEMKGKIMRSNRRNGGEAKKKRRERKAGNAGEGRGQKESYGNNN
jgi:hypothetical protein